MKFILGLISLIGAVAYGIAIASLYDSGLFAIPQVKAAFIGFVTGAGLWALLGKKLSFFGTFEHELTHLIFSALMFQRPRSFYASEKRGHVSCDSGNFIDGLAPYYFPTFSYVLLGLYPLLRSSSYVYFYPLLGFFTGYHLVSNIGDFELHQSDIKKSGALFSIVFCVFASMLTFGFITAFVISGFGGGLDFLARGWHNAGDVVRSGISLAERGLTYLIARAG
jgi:hypothetical protein